MTTNDAVAIHQSPKKLLVLLGPTAVGKTELSLHLAEQFHSPVISCDSRQIYKDLKIGTAAPDKEQLERVKHYFVGILKLTEPYSAARFEEEAISLLETLHRKHDTVVMTGGSMMYIDAVCKGIDELPAIDDALRNNLRERYQREGLEPIRNQLKLLDPAFYKQVDLRNHKRVIHALEICLMTGKPYSSLRTNPVKKRPFQIIKIGLMREREELYTRINRRVDAMMEHGLLDEARQLYPYRHLNALNTVGYKELFKYLDGEWTLDVAVEKIKQNTRIYSRKQMTWFRRDKDIHWLDAENLHFPEVSAHLQNPVFLRFCLMNRQTEGLNTNNPP
ncbi:MAG: tRNA (adenosine(37)-N6)-dimethylallyltransferase MiaA [Dysgonamonadaceae bacterium]|jgi:tRNA dimethylallyltransferase|nr:tRNA (adenosine(37)-N6)-dimethylallyltransferase MiaA [Dysgonamonadaceae bacterium]